MKYIVFEKYEPGIGLTLRLPVIFPVSLVHADVTGALQQSEGLRGYKPVSAGECSIPMGVRCGGLSDTLSLAADDDDGLRIDMIDHTGGVE